MPQTIIDLQKQIENLMAKIQQMESEISTKDKQIADLQEKLNNAKDDLVETMQMWEESDME